MPPVPLRDVVLHRERLHAGWSGTLDCALGYTNLAELRPEFALHMARDIYAARPVRMDPIDLGLLPRSAQVITDAECLLTVDGAVVDDQLSPALRAEPDRLTRLLATKRPVQTVDGEAMLAARYGIGTWGHWLGELLPRVAVVERRYPGRFRYALPRPALAWRNMHGAYRRINESLHAYGIGDDRILPLDQGCDYRFRELYALTPVWSDFALHPQAAEALRQGLPGPDAAPSGDRVALLRTDVAGRNIENLEELRPILQAAGFRFVDSARLPFTEQVALFRGAEAVAGVLGSGLTGLVYARPGVRVLSMAPAVFGDRFFYGLTQERRGRFADLRGPVHTPHPLHEHYASFTIAPELLEAGLRDLGLAA